MKLLVGKSIKTVILMLAPLIIGAICSLLGDWNKSQPYFWYKVISLILIGILYIIYLLYITKNEIPKDRLTIENIALRKTASSILAINKMTSNELNKFSNTIKNKGCIDLRDWNFDEVAIHICKGIFTVLEELSINDNKIDVTYVKLVEDGKYKNHIKTVGCEAPDRVIKSFNKIRDYTDKHGHYDCKIFNESLYEIKAVDDPQKVFEMFNFSNRDNSEKKYSQYLNFPIVCDSQKIVGLIQVVTRGDTKLANSESELEAIAKIYLSQFGYVALAFSKAEKAITSIPSTHS